MSITFENKAEAFAMIITVVASADNKTTQEERKFLFENVKSYDVFNKYDPEQFVKLLEDITEKVYLVLYKDDLDITEESILILCEAAKKVLDTESRVAAFQMAVELACIDRLVKIEKKLLDMIQEGLEIDKKIADQIIYTTLLPNVLR